MSRQLNSWTVALAFTIVLTVYGCIPLRLIAQDFGNLEGTVIADGSYPSGALVRILELGCEKERNKTLSQADGSFQLPRLPSDQYCLEVTYRNFDRYLIPTLRVLPGPNPDLVIQLKKNNSLITPAVYGDVRLLEQNGTLGDRLENASVKLGKITGKPQGRVEQGRFQIAKLQTRRYDVYVIPDESEPTGGGKRAASRSYHAGSLELSETTTRIEVDIRLPREIYAQLRHPSPFPQAATLTGTATDSTGAAMPGATITAINSATGLALTIQADENGEYALEGPFGTYTVKAEREGFQSRRNEIVLAANQKSLLDLHLSMASETVSLAAAGEEEIEERNLLSKAGYIDTAIVASQVRIRFEAGFHNNAPDRAELFYAQCKCNGGPGPDAIVTDLHFQQLSLRAEYAPTKRFSLFTRFRCVGLSLRLSWDRKQSRTRLV